MFVYTCRRNFKLDNLRDIFDEFVQSNPLCVNMKGKLVSFCNLETCMEMEKIVRLEFDRRTFKDSGKNYISYRK